MTLSRKELVLMMCLLFCYSMVSAQKLTVYDGVPSQKQFNSKLLKNSILVSTATVLAFTLDKPVQNWMTDLSSSSSGKFINVANSLGEKTIIVPALGLSLGIGYLIDDSKLKHVSWNAIKAVATTAVITEIIKISAGRARPFTDEGPRSFHPFSNDDKYKSLPSGHTSLAFAVFTPFAESYSRWLYLAPTSVAFARMYKNKHWFSDVVLGGGIGFISGWIFTHHPKNNIQVTSNSVVVFF